MEFEEMKEKLDEIVNGMGNFKTEQETLTEMEDYLEEAKKSGDTKKVEAVKETLERLNDHHKIHKNTGMTDMLTDEQAKQLEEKITELEKAVTDIKEFKDSSTADKIDGYVKKKTRENDDEIDEKQEENDCLKSKKRELNGIYDKYETNKKAVDIANKLSTLLEDIKNKAINQQLSTTTPEKQQELQDEIDKQVIDVKILLEKPEVKNELGSRVDELKLNHKGQYDPYNIRTIKEAVDDKTLVYELKRDEASDQFDDAFGQVDKKYEHNSGKHFLENVDQEKDSIEDKWKALNERIGENTDRIVALEGENKFYNGYAEKIKTKQLLEDRNNNGQQLYNDYENSNGQGSAQAQINQLVENNREFKQAKTNEERATKEYESLIRLDDRQKLLNSMNYVATKYHKNRTIMNLLTSIPGLGNIWKNKYKRMHETDLEEEMKKCQDETASTKARLQNSKKLEFMGNLREDNQKQINIAQGEINETISKYASKVLGNDGDEEKSSR